MTANRQFAAGRLCRNATPLLAVLPLLGLLPAPVQACVIVSGTMRISGTLTTSCVVVNSNGTISIEDGGTLILTGTSGDVSTVTSTGSIVLKGATSQLRFTTNSHTVCGSGRVVGYSDNATITIATGITLINRTNIEGCQSITGDGTFINDGTVNANCNGTLLIEVDTVDDTDGDDRWMATLTGAELDFSADIDTLGPMEGECVVTAGEIEFNEALTTTGRLDISGGVLDVNEDVTMGSQVLSHFLRLTGGTIDVAPGKTFTHD